MRALATAPPAARCLRAVGAPLMLRPCSARAGHGQWVWTMSTTRRACIGCPGGRTDTWSASSGAHEADGRAQPTGAATTPERCSSARWQAPASSRTRSAQRRTRTLLAGALLAVLVRVELAQVDQQLPAVPVDAQLAPHRTARSMLLSARHAWTHTLFTHQHSASQLLYNWVCWGLKASPAAPGMRLDSLTGELRSRLVRPGLWPQMCSAMQSRALLAEQTLSAVLRFAGCNSAHGPALAGQGQLERGVARRQRRGDGWLRVPDGVKLLWRQRQALARGLQLAVALHACFQGSYRSCPGTPR